MLFHSPLFLFWFFPLALLGFHLLPRQRLVFLLVASWIFYAWWNPIFLPLLLASTVVNYIAGGRIAAASSVRRKRLWLWSGIAFNLLLLGFFKYEGMLSDLLETLAGTPVLPALSLALPLGISFFTFEGISYLVDIYRGASPSKNMREFACFLSFFPHLIAGPIIRFPAIAPQFHALNPSDRDRAEGIYRFTMGLAKKLILADTLATVADPAFGALPASSMAAWIGLIAYTLQIYLDFSSYTDMAIGLGLLFGFRLPENFDRPYFSASIGEFWRRWHRTLSFWFRDYVYIPLGGNRRGVLPTIVNLFLTMTLAGLWHGANWTFALWGAYYGLLLGIERVLALTQLPSPPLAVRRLWTLFLVMMGWVLFRSTSVGAAGLYYRRLFWIGSRQEIPFWEIAAVLGGCLFVCAEWSIPLCPQRFTPKLATGFALCALCALFFAFARTSSPFLYFQF
jgi:alginate O-acetyltransferase complex protein AlgI